MKNENPRSTSYKTLWDVSNVHIQLQPFELHTILYSDETNNIYNIYIYIVVKYIGCHFTRIVHFQLK